MAYTLSDLGWAHGGVAQLNRGAEMLDEARELWRELGNLPMLANNLSVSALFAFLRAEYEVPVANSAEALEISRSIDNVWGQWSAASAPCFTYLELGEVGKSIEAAELADSLSREGGLVLQQPFGDRIIAWAHAYVGAIDLGRPYYLRAKEAALDGVPAPLRSWMLALVGMFEIADGDLDSAATHIEEAQAGFDLKDFTYPSSAFVLLARGQLALAQNDVERAVAESNEMIEILQSAGARAFVPDALHFKGKGLLAQGKTAEARECLAEASALAEETGSMRSLWQALGALCEVEAGLGNHAEAERSRERALEVVRFIAERTGSDELRDSFLALPNVRSIVG